MSESEFDPQIIRLPKLPSSDVLLAGLLVS
jgi:hypothetical protein